MADIPIEEIEGYLFEELHEDRMREIDALTRVDAELRHKIAVIGTVLGVIPTDTEAENDEVTSKQLPEVVETVMHPFERFGSKVRPSTLLARVAEAAKHNDRTEVAALFNEFYALHSESAESVVRQNLPKALSPEMFPEIMRQSFVRVWQDIQAFWKVSDSPDAWVLRKIYEVASDLVKESRMREGLPGTEHQAETTLRDLEES